jgi:hypothetical protein
VQEEVPQPPPYNALDANYHVTWSQFAQWMNTLLEQAPAEIQALKEASQGLVQESERGTSLRRIARSTSRDPAYDPTVDSTFYASSFLPVGFHPHPYRPDKLEIAGVNLRNVQECPTVCQPY